MIKIGEYQTLTICRRMPQGFYLIDEEENEVLFPQKYITEDMEIDDEIEVFVYCDTNDVEVATTESPYLIVDEFACLKVTDVNEVGAFCKWGVQKDLFIPYRNQHTRLHAGKYYVVYMFLDEVTDRLVGSTKVYTFLDKFADDDIEKGDEVDLMVYDESDIGYNVIINSRYSGLVYHSDSPDELDIGEKLIGFIKPIREDGKIDVSLFPLGYKNIEPNAAMILEKLEENSGVLPYSDKSDPEAIKREFGISKKLFKKSIGALYKDKKIRIERTGIYLIK